MWVCVCVCFWSRESKHALQCSPCLARARTWKTAVWSACIHMCAGCSAGVSSQQTPFADGLRVCSAQQASSSYAATQDTTFIVHTPQVGQRPLKPYPVTSRCSSSGRSFGDHLLVGEALLIFDFTPPELSMFIAALRALSCKSCFKLHSSSWRCAVCFAPLPVSPSCLLSCSTHSMMPCSCYLQEEHRQAADCPRPFRLGSTLAASSLALQSE